MRICPLIAPLVAVLLGLPSPALAWGPEGHQVVALIAYARLTPEAKAGTKAILGEGRDIFDADIVDWADRIRSGRKDFGPYHYVNADVTQRAIDLKRDGNGGINVVEGLVDQIKVLRQDPTAKGIPFAEDGGALAKETLPQAMRWVVHMVGDLHQPLHCTDRNGDQGGNKVKVRFNGADKETNLHALYDSGLLRTYVNDYLAKRRSTKRPAPSGEKEAPDITDYAMSIDAKVSPSDAKAWAGGTPLDWANDAHLVGVRDVYADLPRGDPVVLDARYAAKKQAVVERQLAKAGIRLASVLNKTFAPAPTTRPTTRPAR